MFVSFWVVHSNIPTSTTAVVLETVCNLFLVCHLAETRRHTVKGIYAAEYCIRLVADDLNTRGAQGKACHL